MRKVINVVYKVDDHELNQAKTAIQGVEKETKDSEREMLKLDKAIKKTGQDGQKSFGDFGTILKGIGWAALAASVYSLGKKIYDLGVKQEQVNIAFTTFLGSATKAKKLMAELNKYAIITPFTVDQINGAAKALLAFGVKGKEVMPILKMLGDISAGTGKDLTELSIIFGQIRSTGRLMGQDLLQLINAGFNPLTIISEKTGKSMKTLKSEMENGAISFKMVEDAFISATSAGGLFYQMTIKQGQSIGGLMSTIGGNIDEGLKNIYTATEGPLKAFVDELVILSEAWIDFTKSKGQLSDERETQAIDNAVEGYKTYLKFTQDSTRAIELQTVAIEKRKKELQDEIQQRLDTIINVTPGISYGNPTGGDNYESTKAKEEAREKNRLAQVEIDALKKAVPAINDYIESEKLAAEAVKDTGEETKLTTAQMDALAKKRAAALKNIGGKMGFSTAAEKVKDKEEEGKKLDKIETENLKRSNALQTYFADLRVKKEKEVQDELNEIQESNSAKRQKKIDDEEANKMRAQERSVELGIQAGAMALELLFTQKEQETNIIQEKYNKELKAAGNNERAKVDIERRRDMELALIERKNKEIRKKNAIVRIGIDTATAVGKTFAEFGWPAGVVPASIMAGIGALQIAAVRKFKKGEVNIDGPGTTTSDSIPAFLSRGESVINAQATSKSKNLLEAINERKIDDKLLSRISTTNNGVNFDDTRIVDAINKNRVDYMSQGYTLYKTTEMGGNFKKTIRAKVQGY